MNNQNLICEFLGCKENISIPNRHGISNLCDYHANGGALRSGETFRQYQIIEDDFINFIRVVPLVKDHFKVFSPILRDIIIRTCVQIELFFKEWSKKYCTDWKQNNLLLDKFNKNEKGVRNWTFGDYFIFKEEFNDIHPVEVMPLGDQIMPFSTWESEKKPPLWWNVYNEIKHGSDGRSNKCNLHIALEALAALYLMLFKNEESNQHLKKFVSNNLRVVGLGKLKSESLGYTTPIDSKQYLFRIVNTGSQTEHSIVEDFEYYKSNIR
ncbi:MAG: hypothetical protein KA275_04410 [Chitinophagaceae bacterium]|nr:hypothetical protein [Chitinophagaceae bacterium]